MALGGRSPGGKRLTSVLCQYVRDPVTQGRFKVYALNHVDDAMALLTGMAPGERTDDQAWSEGSISL